MGLWSGGGQRRARLVHVRARGPTCSPAGPPPRGTCGAWRTSAGSPGSYVTGTAGSAWCSPSSRPRSRRWQTEGRGEGASPTAARSRDRVCQQSHASWPKIFFNTWTNYASLTVFLPFLIISSDIYCNLTPLKLKTPETASGAATLAPPEGAINQAGNARTHTRLLTC